MRRAALPHSPRRHVALLIVTMATIIGLTLGLSRAEAADDQALNRPTTASSSETPAFLPGNAVDGEAQTRWSSKFSDGEWWQVDLESVHRIDRVEINWETAYASRYQILTSTDGTGFSLAADVTNEAAGWETTKFEARDARYVRVLGVTRATQWGISFWDVQVFGLDDTATTSEPPATETATTSEPPATETATTSEPPATETATTSEPPATGTATTSEPSTTEPTISSENKALGRSTSASSSETATYTPPKAVDSVEGTRWSSTFADNQWWQVDLGSVRSVSEVRLNWEKAYASRYQILTSTDGAGFSLAADVTSAAAGWKTTKFAARDARYVRVLGVTRATRWGISFWDAQVYGPEDAATSEPPTTEPTISSENKALGRSTSASSSETATYTPPKAVDSVSGTRWSSNFTNNQWWQVDLGGLRSVSEVRLNWEAAYASRYQILTSTDGAGFSLAADVTTAAAGWKTTTFAVRDARYVRVLGVTRATPWGISFWDAQVFGPEDSVTSDKSPPGAPAGLTKTGATETSITASWNPSSDNVGVIGYDLYVNGAKVGVTSGTTHTFTGLACATSYTLGVEARDAAGNLSTRSTLSASTVACPTASAAGITPPTGPSPYTLPTGALTVSTSAQLVTALAGSTPRDIVLADGVYDNSTIFLNQWGHRLYAANLGKAVLRAGLVLGGNYGPGNTLVRGIALDVSDPARTLYGSVIHVWGTGKNTRVMDVTIDGRMAIPTGIFVRQPQGFVAERVAARNFTSNGIRVDTAAGLTTAPRLQDLDLSTVSRPVPMSSNGTAESCLWLGSQVSVKRVRVRRCAWMGIWTGSGLANSVLEDLDIDQTPTGIYFEHYTTDSVFQRIHVRSKVSHGVYCEWASPEYGGRPASVDNVIQDSTFESSLVGVYMDEGTTRTTVRRSKFIGQSWAAIGDFRGIGNAYYDNDYSGIDVGAVGISLNHVPPWDGVGRFGTLS